MTFRSFLSALAFSAATVLALASAGPAQAESGAHRNPPPPSDTLAVIGDEA